MGMKEAWAALWGKRSTLDQAAPGRPLSEQEITVAQRVAAAQQVPQQPAGISRDPAYMPYNDPGSQLGPGVPPQPMPLGGEPRQSVYRPGWNIPSAPGEGRISAETLRFFADNYDLLRRCIEVRKAEIKGLEWDIVPLERNKKKSQTLRTENAKLIEQIKAFFESPEAYMVQDGKGWNRRGYVTWDEWLGAILEEYFVGDWLTIYPRRKLNGELLRLDRVDGSTIKVLLMVDGRTPLPPDPAYNQWLHGRVAAQFTVEELIYKPRNRRNNTPYGYSNVEQILAHINEAIRYQMWTTAYFTDGSIPEGFFTAPENWTTEQIREFNDYINAELAGDPKALRQFHLIPHGSTYLSVKPFQFDDKFARFLAEKTCVLMDVQPTEVGWTPQSGLGGAGFSEGQEAVTKRKSLGPLAKWLAGLFTEIIHNHFGATDLGWVWTSLQNENEKELVDTDQARLLSGQATLDQILQEHGDEPVGVNTPFVVAGGQLLFLPDLLNAQKHGVNAVTGFGGLFGSGPYGGGSGGRGDPDDEDDDEGPGPPDDGGSGGKPKPGRQSGRASPQGDEDVDEGKAAAQDDDEARAAVAEVMQRDYPQLPESWADAYNWRLSRVKLDSIQAGRRPSKRNPDKLKALLQAIEDGEELPPLIVVEEGDARQMVDGYHRWWAYREAVREVVEVYLGEPAWYDLYRPGGDAYEQEQQKAATAQDLARWKRKALKDVRAGRAPRPFASTAIPADVAGEIAAKLASARTPDDVKAVFGRRQKIVRLVPQNPSGVADATRRMAEKLQRFLQGEAERFADWVVAQVFPEGEKAVMADSRKIAGFLDGFDWFTWADMLIDPLATQMRKIHRQGMYDVFATLEIDLEDSFKLRNQKAEVYAKRRGAELAGKRILPTGEIIDNLNPEFALTESTREMLRGTITRALEEGLTPASLREEIITDYAFSPTRANAIATTEAAFAYNDATIEAYQESGVVDQVRVEDGDGCEACKKINGQIWTLEQARANPLEHPHCKRVFYPIVEV